MDENSNPKVIVPPTGTRPGGRGGSLNTGGTFAGSGRKPGEQPLTALLKEFLAEGTNDRKAFVRACIKQAKEGNGAYAKIIFDRVDGPTVEKVEHSGSIEFENLTDEERAARTLALLDRARARRTGSDPDGE